MVDFRIRNFDGNLSKMPGWSGPLYQQIKTELKTFQ
jgi:hypothetical protein